MLCSIGQESYSQGPCDRELWVPSPICNFIAETGHFQGKFEVVNAKKLVGIITYLENIMQIA